MPRILIAAELRELMEPDPIPGWAIDWIPAADPTPDGDYVAAIPILSRRFGEAEFATLPALRIVANCAVGFDNIDLEAARRHGVIVTNTPNVLTDATADIAWYLILAVARRVKEGEILVREGRWSGWHPQQLLGLELRGATLGIVGAGRIGQAVGRRAEAFGMRVLYADPTVRPEFEGRTGARRVELRDLLGQADIVSLHVPSTPDTRGLVDDAFLARMRPGALLVNTARGDVVREPALVAALERGHLAGAGLDVFAHEPSVPPEFVAHPRVVTLPHLGSATVRTRRAMVDLALRNAREVLAGRAPLTPV